MRQVGTNLSKKVAKTNPNFFSNIEMYSLFIRFVIILGLNFLVIIRIRHKLYRLVLYLVSNIVIGKYCRLVCIGQLVTPTCNHLVLLFPQQCSGMVSNLTDNKETFFSEDAWE